MFAVTLSSLPRPNRRKGERENLRLLLSPLLSFSCLIFGAAVVD